MREIIGRSAAILAVLDDIQRIAPFDIDVLITGETGTGKELVARYVHQHSCRRDGPFVPVDAGAIPSELLEREFFGHEAGAFTGAHSRMQGLFEAATCGTLFLDEIGNLPVSLQAKLLRVIQERCVRRLGGIRPVAVDIRIIAATSVDLEQAVGENHFRLDLYHRINVARINVPPLRARSGDVPLLVYYFQTSHGPRLGHESVQFAAETLAAMKAYRWPGNVRELENVVQRALVTCRHEVVGPEHLPPELRLAVLRHGNFGAASARDSPPGAHHNDGADKAQAPHGMVSLEAVVREHVLRVMSYCGGNRARTAAILRIDPKTLRRKLRTYGYGEESHS